jgi:hypothetical protein
MDKNILYACMFLECGRKFETQDLLKKHEERRHPDYFKDRYPEDNKIKNQQEKKSKNILEDLENKIKVIENDSIFQQVKVKTKADKINKDKQNDNEYDNNISKIDTNLEIKSQTSVEFNIEEGLEELDNYKANEILADDDDLDEEENDYITDEMLMIGGKYADYEEVDEVKIKFYIN